MIDDDDEPPIVLPLPADGEDSPGEEILEAERGAHAVEISEATKEAIEKEQKKKKKKGKDHDCDCGCSDCVPVNEPATDDIVADIDPDCAGGVGLVSYPGYLAESTGGKGAVWRLYLTLQLDEYLLLRKEDIVAQRKDGKGSRIWLRRDRTVRYVRVRTPNQLQAEFLAGEIAALRRDVSPIGQSAFGSDAEGPVTDSLPPCPQSKYTRCYPC